MSNATGSLNGSEASYQPCQNPFCDKKIPVGQDGCPEHDGQEAAQLENSKRLIEARREKLQGLIDVASDPASAYAAVSDNARASFDEAVVKEILTAHARRAAKNALNPPVGWADNDRFQTRPVRNPPTVMPYFVDNPFETEYEETGLFYKMAINTIFGDAEVGKSLLNYAIHAHEINKGNHTVHLDFDNNTAEEAFWRVVDSGADVEDVRRLFHVAEMPSSLPAYDFVPTYVSLDCVNSAIAFMGGELNSSGTGVDQAYQTYLSPFVSQGACALALDHVNKSDKSQASNTIRKVQAVSGISYRMEALGDGGKIGSKWGSTLTPTKDRPGSGPPKEQVAAYIEFDGTASDGTVVVTVKREAANGMGTAIPDDITDAEERLIFTIVSGEYDGSLTVSNIEDEYKAKANNGKAVSRKTIMRILHRLREDGKIGGKQDSRGVWKYFAAIPEEVAD